MQTRLILLVISFVSMVVILTSASYLHAHRLEATLINYRQANKEITQPQLKKEKISQNEGDISLIAVGDIMLSRIVASKIKTNKDPYYPFLNTTDYLRDADITFGNLENPITAGRAIEVHEMVFHADPGMEKVLGDVGFDVLSLANNHSPNFGAKGLIDTFSYLDQVGVLHPGAGKTSKEANSPVYITRKGKTFAFLAYNDPDVVPKEYEATEKRAGTAFMRSEKMIESVKEAKQKADFVIVSIHSGKEYTKIPNTSQTNFAHKAIDAGAEMVIGHHPHVIQSVEKYNGKYILYSLGNFVFDQRWEETKLGLSAKIFFNEQGVREISFFPIMIRDFSQPEILKGEIATKTLERLGEPFAQGSIIVQ